MPARITAMPVITSAKRSGTRWYTSTRSSSAPPIVLRSRVATPTPTPTSARATIRRTASAWDRTRRRGDTDTTTPPRTPTWSLTPSGAIASALCTSFILARDLARSDDAAAPDRSGRGTAPGSAPGAGTTAAGGSELGEHRVRRAHVEAGRRLDHQLGDHAVLDDRGVALRAGAEAEPTEVELQVHLGRELAVAVGQHQDAVAGVLRLAPRPHHEDVVDGDAGDRVDALGPDVVGPQDEARQVVVGARGRERPGHGEEDDLAGPERLGALHGPGTLVGHGHQLDVGDLVADRDRHRTSSNSWGRRERSCLIARPTPALGRRRGPVVVGRAGRQIRC